MAMSGGFHQCMLGWSDVDKLPVKRKEVGRGLISVEQYRREEENSLGFR